MIHKEQLHEFKYLDTRGDVIEEVIERMSKMLLFKESASLKELVAPKSLSKNLSAIYLALKGSPGNKTISAIFSLSLII